MAIKNPKESTKKRVVLPDPIKFLENLVQPLDSEVMESRAMQPIIGYLGPPGHVPPIRATTEALRHGFYVDDLLKALHELIPQIASKDPTLLRGIKQIIATPFATRSRRSMPIAYMSSKEGNVVIDPTAYRYPPQYKPSLSELNEIVRHEGTHGIDRAVLEQLFPREAAIPLKQGGYLGATDLLQHLSTSKYQVPHTISQQSRQSGRQIFDKLARESGQSHRKYGNIPVADVAIPEQFAIMNETLVRPPTWDALIKAFIGIVEGKY